MVVIHSQIEYLATERGSLWLFAYLAAALLFLVPLGVLCEADSIQPSQFTVAITDFVGLVLSFQQNTFAIGLVVRTICFLVFCTIGLVVGTLVCPPAGRFNVALSTQLTPGLSAIGLVAVLIERIAWLFDSTLGTLLLGHDGSSKTRLVRTGRELVAFGQFVCYTLKGAEVQG
jgi:hypothetical protein